MASQPRPLEDLSPTGLLWLINTAALHPRGYAMALHYDDEGKVEGWSVVGDGKEAWRFAMTDAEMDEKFRAVQALLDESAAEATTPHKGA